MFSLRLGYGSISIECDRSHGRFVSYRWHEHGSAIPCDHLLHSINELVECFSGLSSEFHRYAIDEIAKHDWSLAAAYAIAIGKRIPPVNEVTDRYEDVSLRILNVKNELDCQLRIPMSVWVGILSNGHFETQAPGLLNNDKAVILWSFENAHVRLTDTQGHLLYLDVLESLSLIEGWQIGPEPLAKTLLKHRTDFQADMILEQDSEQELKEERTAYSEFLKGVESILTDFRHRDDLVDTMTWREALNLYKIKFDTDAPLWVCPNRPESPLYPALAIRVLEFSIKSNKDLPMDFYLSVHALIAPNLFEETLLAEYESRQLRARQKEKSKTEREASEDRIPCFPKPSSIELEPIRDTEGRVAAYWLPVVNEKNRQSEEASSCLEGEMSDDISELFRRGDRQALLDADRDGLLAFDSLGASWFKTSYGKEFLKMHSVPAELFPEFKGGISAGIRKPGGPDKGAMLGPWLSDDRVQKLIRRHRRVVRRVSLPPMTVDHIWLELNALEQGWIEEAKRYALDLTGRPMPKIGEEYEGRILAVTLEPYRVSVADFLKDPLEKFDALRKEADAVGEELQYKTTRDFLIQCGVAFEIPSVVSTYRSEAEETGWIPSGKGSEVVKKSIALLQRIEPWSLKFREGQKLRDRIALLTREIDELREKLPENTYEFHPLYQRRIINSPLALELLIELEPIWYETGRRKPGFIYGPFISDGETVLVATSFSAVPLPNGLYASLLSRIQEAIPVKIEKLTKCLCDGTYEPMVPVTQKDWEDLWLSVTRRETDTRIVVKPDDDPFEVHAWDPTRLDKLRATVLTAMYGSPKPDFQFFLK